MVQNWKFQSDKSSQKTSHDKLFASVPHISWNLTCINTSKSLSLQPIHTITKYRVTSNMKNTHL